MERVQLCLPIARQAPGLHTTCRLLILSQRTLTTARPTVAARRTTSFNRLLLTAKPTLSTPATTSPRAPQASTQVKTIKGSRLHAMLSLRLNSQHIVRLAHLPPVSVAASVVCLSVCLSRVRSRKLSEIAVTFSGNRGRRARI